ncbi:hypothetical protein C4Q31_03375 [Leptospira borgpetersenii serovar Ceylonica]|nr:hypothetical protein C4Q31_03375 [Leptospira borgpetersenii serovar Ceylonica]
MLRFVEQHKNSGETLFTKAFQVTSYFSYEICERLARTFLQRVPKPRFTLSERSSCKILSHFWDRILYRIH